MAIEELPVVRKDTHVVVFTEHPDHIGPKQLSDECLNCYGENQFKIALLRNIYVIYVLRVPIIADSDTNLGRQVSAPAEGLEVKLKDIKTAEKILRDARLRQVQEVGA